MIEHKINDQNPPLHKTSVSGSTLISECDLSIRTKKLFENAKMETIDDILKTPLTTLMRFRGFGRRSLSELRQFLINNNLSFDND
jgi:DNA-directed RNA polymerase alpha subunit